MTITWKLSFINMNLKVSLKKKTCFKGISNPRCTDLFLANNALSFQSTQTLSTDLLDFHKLVLTVLKTSIVKDKLWEMQYFGSRKCNRDLEEEFSRGYVNSCSKFDEIFLKVLNRHAPLKRKCLRLIIHRMCLKRQLKLSWKDRAFKTNTSKNKTIIL